MKRSPALTALCVIAALGGAACKKKPAPATPTTDAGQDAAPAPREARASEARIVARVLGRHGGSFAPLEDGRVLFDAGLFVYEARRDGTLARIGDLASYAALVPEGDDDITGYDVKHLPWRRAFEGRLPDALFALDYPDGARRFDGKTWSKAVVPQAMEARGDRLYATERRASPRGDVEDPEGFWPWQRRVLADGASVALGRVRDADGGDEERLASVLTPAGSKKGRFVPLDPGFARSRFNCEFLPSFDGRAYVTCNAWDSDDVGRLLAFDGERWSRVTVPDEVARGGSLTVGPDGAIWFATKTNDAVARLAPRAGDVARTSLPVPSGLERPALEGGEVVGVKASAAAPIGPDLREWVTVRVLDAKPAKELRHVGQIVPTGPAEAWVLAYDQELTEILFHVGPARAPSAAPARAPLVIGSPLDQRVELRNQRPPRPWVGHCPQVFVTLARARPGATLDRDRVWSKKAEIAKIVGAAKGTAYERAAALATGTLAGRDVAGVLLLRPSPEVSEKEMERAAADLVDELADNPVTPPEATCTTPMLETIEWL